MSEIVVCFVIYWLPAGFVGHSRMTLLILQIFP